MSTDARYRSLLRAIIILVPLSLASLLSHWRTEATPLRWVNLSADALLLVYAVWRYVGLPPVNVARTSRHATRRLLGVAILGFVVVASLAAILHRG